MFEKVTVTEAMADDMEKLRPRLKNVHIRELAVAITMMPKIQEVTCTCRRRCHGSQAQPVLHPAAPITAHPGPPPETPPQPRGSSTFLRDLALRGQHIHFIADTNSEMTLFGHLIGHVTLGRRKMLIHDQYFLEHQFFSQPAGTNAGSPVREGQLLLCGL